LDENRCRRLFEEEQGTLAGKVKRSVEAKLAEAGLLETHDFVVLQAFTLFIVSAFLWFSKPDLRDHS